MDRYSIAPPGSHSRKQWLISGGQNYPIFISALRAAAWCRDDEVSALNQCTDQLPRASFGHADFF
jgi:hypothetical protein